MHAEKITQLLSAKSYPADFAAKTQNPVSCAALSSWQTWHWIHLSWWDYDHLYLLICCGRPWVRWVDEGGGPVETGCQDWYYPLHPFRCSQTVMRRSSIRSCLRSCCYGEWHFKTLQSDCLQGFFYASENGMLHTQHSPPSLRSWSALSVIHKGTIGLAPPSLPLLPSNTCIEYLPIIWYTLTCPLANSSTKLIWTNHKDAPLCSC